MDKEKELPQRKRLRLQNFDYSSSGAYFITICTKDRKMLFAPVGADSISARMVERTFLETIRQYDGVESPIYVVMPNHFHAIITVSRADMESAPTVCQSRCILAAANFGGVGAPRPTANQKGERRAASPLAAVPASGHSKPSVQSPHPHPAGKKPPFDKGGRSL